MNMTCLFVCTGRNFISYKNDGSFFVPYLYFCFLSLVLKNNKTKDSTLYCLSVWNVFKDHFVAYKECNRGCFPKASAKV